LQCDAGTDMVAVIITQLSRRIVAVHIDLCCSSGVGGHDCCCSYRSLLQLGRGWA